MKNKRHNRIIALSLAVAAMLAGCGHEVQNSEEKPTSAVTVTGSEKTTSPQKTSAASGKTTKPETSTSSLAEESSAPATSAAPADTTQAEEGPVLTNAPAADNRPYSPGIENPPETGGGNTQPSGGHSGNTPPSTAKKTTAATKATRAATKTTPATTTKAAVKPAKPTNADDMLKNMTLHEKVCQMFMAAPEGLTGYGSFNYADDHTYSCYDSYPIGGYIFFANNLVTSDQTRKMLSDLQSHARAKGPGVFLATDEEGGRITRVSYKLGAPAVYDMSYYGSLNDYDTSFGVGSTIGTYLADYGFNVDFAPVADVNLNPYNELGNRIFSSDPAVVASMSGAVVDGLQSAGVCGTLKHFPGLGAGGSNTHYGTVVMDRSYEQLSSAEFVAFKGGIDAGAEFVMLGHQVVTGAGDNMPADLSKVVVTDWLRGDLGFDGIAITDAQAMGAIVNVYGSSEAAVLSVEAGIDIILMPADLKAAVSGVEQAVSSGRISESRIDESVLRILRQKEKLGIL